MPLIGLTLVNVGVRLLLYVKVSVADIPFTLTTKGQLVSIFEYAKAGTYKSYLVRCILLNSFLMFYCACNLATAY